MDIKMGDYLPGSTVSTVCRCCLAEGCYKDISTEYFWMGKREVYSEMLKETLNLSIAFSKSGTPNSNSRLICEACISKLREATDFKKQVQQCEKMFMQHLDPGRLVEIEVIPASSKESVKVECVKLENEASDEDGFEPDAFDQPAVDDDDDYDDMDDQPLTSLAKTKPAMKKETTDILDIMSNRQVTVKRKIPETETRPSKRKKDVKPSASKQPVAKVKKSKDGEDSTDVPRNNAMLILSHSTAYPFEQSGLSFRCCFCLQNFDDPSLFRSHVDTLHSNVDKSTSLKHYNNSLTRVDITDLRCTICMKHFDNIEPLAEHLVTEHDVGIDMSQCLSLVPFRLNKNKLACTVCSKVVCNMVQLTRHTGLHYSRNVCHTCGKQFETLRGLKNHVTFSHSNHEYLCRTCKKPFTSLEDKREHAATSKKCWQFRCKVCKERFRNDNVRLDHMETVHGKQKSQFTCSGCGKVFKKRMERYFHFKITHTDDNECRFCGQQFRTPRERQEHISREHTGERPHKCSMCDKTFVAIKTLKRHEITHDDSRKQVCPSCGRLFIEKSRLKQHLKKHHADVYAKEFCETKTSVP